MAHGWCVVWAEKLQGSNMQYGSHIEAISYLVLCHCCVPGAGALALVRAGPPICCLLPCFLASFSLFTPHRLSCFNCHEFMHTVYGPCASALQWAAPSTSFRQGASFFSYCSLTPQRMTDTLQEIEARINISVLPRCQRTCHICPARRRPTRR